VLRLISTLFLLTAICFAQEQPEPASLEGKVTNLIGGQAVREVNLTLRPMGGASGNLPSPTERSATPMASSSSKPSSQAATHYMRSARLQRAARS